MADVTEKSRDPTDDRSRRALIRAPTLNSCSSADASGTYERASSGRSTWASHCLRPSLQTLKEFQDLRDKFKDPLSPFYLAPGEKGPESPDPAPSSPATEQVSHGSAAVEARKELTRMGYDPTAFYEQKVVWGDHDSFQWAFRILPRGLLMNKPWILSDT